MSENERAGATEPSRIPYPLRGLLLGFAALWLILVAGLSASFGFFWSDFFIPFLLLALFDLVINQAASSASGAVWFFVVGTIVVNVLIALALVVSLNALGGMAGLVGEGH